MCEATLDQTEWLAIIPDNLYNYSGTNRHRIRKRGLIWIFFIVYIIVTLYTIICVICVIELIED
jgi:hypothetical protein